jgi:hypothetical protein
MRKADRAIDRANAIMKKAIDSIQADFAEAEANYRDTGYGRYFKKMQSCEDDIDRLERYICSAVELAKAEREADRYRRMIAKYREKLEALRSNDYVGDRQAGEIICRCEALLKMLEMEVAR